ncbi:MAG: hypothetical protein HYX56_03000 [Chloroflexi bacterium]|nr:hypothetical protein [Chloroflexota bacterium]
MNILRTLREEAKKLHCTVCGADHAKSDIRVVAKLDPAWIVRVTCSSCRTEFKLLVVVQEQSAQMRPMPDERPRTRRRPPVTPDDVIDAHELLKGFSGDVTTLFKAPAASKRPAAKREARA